MTFLSRKITVPAGNQFTLTNGQTNDYFRITRILQRGGTLPIMGQVFSGDSNFAPFPAQQIEVGTTYYPRGGWNQVIFQNPNPASGPGAVDQSFHIEYGFGRAESKRFQPRLGDFATRPVRGRSTSVFTAGGDQSGTVIVAAGANTYGLIVNRVWGIVDPAGSISFSGIMAEFNMFAGPAAQSFDFSEIGVFIEPDNAIPTPTNAIVVTTVGAGTKLLVAYESLAAGQDGNNDAYGAYGQGGGG